MRRPRAGTSTASWPRATTKDGIWGTMILGKQGIEAATRLNAFYQQAGSDIIDAAGKPTIDTDAGHAALEFMTGAVFEDKSAPEGVLELSDMQGAGSTASSRWRRSGRTSIRCPRSRSATGLGKVKIDIAAGQSRSAAATVYSWGFCRRGRVEEPGRGARMGQMVDRDRHARTTSARTGSTRCRGPRRSTRSPADPDISDSDKAAIAAFAASAAAGKTMTMVPQYSQLLDVLGIIQSGVMSKAMSTTTH